MGDDNKEDEKANIPKLDEKNFLQWRMRMLMYLKAKDLDKYISDPKYTVVRNEGGDEDDDDDEEMIHERRGGRRRRRDSRGRYM